MINFIDNEEDSIKNMRKKLGWVDSKDPNKDKHPERWTNRATLLDDIREADKLHGSIIERHFGSNLEYFYETEYRRLNWNIHGSGFAGMSNADASDINIICGFGYLWSAKLALVSAEIILRASLLLEIFDEFGEQNQKCFFLGRKVVFAPSHQISDDFQNALVLFFGFDFSRKSGR